MGKTAHQIEYDNEDWRCLNLYCSYKNTNPTTIMGKLLYNFLLDNKEEIKRLMKEQERIVESRNAN